MLILTQDRNQIINLDNVTSIRKDTTLDKSKILYWVDTATNDTTLLGEYKHTPEHENQIERIAEVYGAINCYVMPKEEI